MKRNLLLGLCLFFAVWLGASRGVHWSLYTHPDEIPVAKWIEDFKRDGYIRKRCLYPSGWFKLAMLKVTCDQKRQAVCTWFDKWTVQDGKVNTFDPRSFRRETDNPRHPASYIVTGRAFNVFLVAVSAVFIFLAALRFGMHPHAALLSGLIVGFNPFVMEHSHYCETDMGLVVCLAAAFWILAVERQRQKTWLFLLFSFACGFATSNKFTLIPLVVPAVALPLAQRKGLSGGSWSRMAVLMFAGLLAFTGGLAFGTPASYRMPGYFEQLLLALQSRHSPAAPESASFSPFLLKTGSVLREMAKLGVLPLAYFALSAGFWFRREYRRVARVLPVFLGLFLLFFFTCMPWVRNQETLPLVVILALGAAFPADWAVRTLAVRRRLLWGPCAVLVLAGLAACATLRDGWRMTTFFLARETRAECQNWLASSLPPGTPICADSYLGFIERGTPGKFLNAAHLEQLYPDPLRKAEIATNNVRYYLRNASFPGRANIRHPFTGRLLPELAAREEHFRRDAIPLVAWHVGAGRFRPAFTQPDVELWRLPADASPPDHPSAPVVDIPVWFPRPAHFRFGGATLYGADALGPLGPEEAIQTVGKRHAVRLSSASPQWLVSRYIQGNGPAKVVIDRLATHRQAVLDKDCAEAFEIGSRTMHAAFRYDAMPAARIRMRGDDQSTFVLTSPTDNPAEAAFLLRTHGAPDKALELLEREPRLSPPAMLEAFRLSVELGRNVRPEWREVAVKTVADFDSSPRTADGHLANDEVCVCGVPLAALKDFARIRLTDEMIFGNARLPIYLPAGLYHVTARLFGNSCGTFAHHPLFDVQQKAFDARQVANGEVRLSGELKLDKGACLRYDADIPTQYHDRYDILWAREIEITWDPESLVAGEVESLRRLLQVASRK